MKELHVKLQKIVDSVPDGKRAAAEALAKEIAFMADTLGKLQADIQANGTTELFRQGSNCYDRERPALKSYTALVPRYGALLKQLTALAPDMPEDEDELEAFLRQG